MAGQDNKNSMETAFMNSSSLQDEKYMRLALLEASRAADRGEVPVGAVVVMGGRAVARACNMRETLADPTAHAEIIAIREAARLCGTWRLDGAVIYCTLEPCAMCAGAMVNARIQRVVYGAPDPKSGACESVIKLFEKEELNHSIHATAGVMAEEGLKLLREFFGARRRIRQKP